MTHFPKEIKKLVGNEATSGLHVTCKYSKGKRQHITTDISSGIVMYTSDKLDVSENVSMFLGLSNAILLADANNLEDRTVMCNSATALYWVYTKQINTGVEDQSVLDFCQEFLEYINSEHDLDYTLAHYRKKPKHEKPKRSRRG